MQRVVVVVLRRLGFYFWKYYPFSFLLGLSRPPRHLREVLNSEAQSVDIRCLKYASAGILHGPSVISNVEIPDLTITSSGEIQIEASGAYVIAKGCIAGDRGAVLDEDSAAVSVSLRNFGRPLLEHSIFGQSLLREIRFAGTVLQLSLRSSENIYHFLVEAFPRIHVARSLGLDFDAVAVDNRSPYVYECLKAVGISADQVIQLEPRSRIRADEVICTTYARDGNISAWAVQFLRDSLLPTAANLSPAKIFINRRGNSRVLKNSESVCHMFEEFGWKIVYLEDYSFSEQVGFFATAIAVAGVHGAGLTHLLFCKPDAPCLELFHPHYLNPCFWKISAIRNAPYYWLVDESSSVLAKRNDGANVSNLHINLDALSRSLHAIESGLEVLEPKW